MNGLGTKLSENHAAPPMIPTLHLADTSAQLTFCNCSVSKCPSFLRRQESRIAGSEVPASAGTMGLLTLRNPLNSELLRRFVLEGQSAWYTLARVRQLKPCWGRRALSGNLKQAPTVQFFLGLPHTGTVFQSDLLLLQGQCTKNRCFCYTLSRRRGI